MLNGWRIKHAETVDCRRSDTGATIAPGWTLPTGIVAITGVTVVDGAIASAGTTAISATMAFRAIASIDENTPTNEIIATIAVKDRHDSQMRATANRSAVGP